MSIINKIGIGTVQFGLSYGISNTKGITPKKEVARILNYAATCGLDILDTAGAYGVSESIIGALNNHRFKVVSKFIVPSSSFKIQALLDNTLSELNSNHIYGYLAHRPNQIIENQEIWRDLQQLKEKGKVEKIGFSLNNPEEFEPFEKHNIWPDLVQIPYNYLDNRFDDLIHTLKEKNCEIHARSSFLQGLFFMDTSKLPAFFDEVKPIICSLQNEYRDNLSAVLLKFVLTSSKIDKVIIGIENLEQLRQNIESLKQAPTLKRHKLRISEEILMPSKWPQQ